ncbi:MAG: sulfotransferase [Pseudomonadota bacterium]
MTKDAVKNRPTSRVVTTQDLSMPNLFVVGASKTGSSALHAYLKLHPQIFMSATKEPCFFVDQSELEAAWPIMARNPVSHDIEAYREMFKEGRDATYRGEASVYYSQSPHRSGVAARIAAAVPDAKIIYVVREPISRTISHYWQRAKEFQDTLPLEQAIREHAIYRDTSDYALQLEEYYKSFDHRQIRVVISEDLRNDRRNTLAQLFEWLEIEDHVYSEEELADVHVSSEKSRRQRFSFVRTIRDSSMWAAAREVIPTRMLDGLRSYATEPVNKSEIDDREIRAWLKDYFAPRINRLETLIDRNLDHWRK